MEENGTNVEVIQSESKKEPAKKKWYHKKGVRILAGVLAVVLTLSAVIYGFMRSRFTSLYVDIVESEDTLREISRSNGNQGISKETLDNLNQYGTLIEYINQTENQKAIAHALELLEKEDDPLMKSALMDILCQLYYLEGQYQDAIDAADTSIATNGDGPIPYFVKGMGEMQLQQYEHASECFKKALEVGAVNESEVYLQLAISSYSAKSYEDAILYADKYIEYPMILKERMPLDKEEEELVTNNQNICKYIAAISCMNLMDFEKSIVYFDELLAQQEDSELYYYRGINNMALEDYESAIVDFKKSRELGKKDTELNYDLGICLISTGNIKEGREELWTVIGSDDHPELATSATNILTALAQEN